MTIKQLKPLGRLKLDVRGYSSGFSHEDAMKCVPPQKDELARIAVPWDPARASQNARPGHYYQERREQKAGQQLALYYWRIDRFTTDERVLVQWWILRGRVMDEVNAHAGLKAIEDGLFKRGKNDGEGVTYDDSVSFKETQFVKQLTGASFRQNEWVVVVIRRHPDQPVKTERRRAK